MLERLRKALVTLVEENAGALDEWEQELVDAYNELVERLDDEGFDLGGQKAIDLDEIAPED